MEKELEVRRQEGRNVEEELKNTKRMNKAAAVVIAVLLILMSLMIANMRNLVNQYEQMEENYVQLYEEMRVR